MQRLVYILFLLVLFYACNKDEDKIDYQTGYPNSIAGNWVAMETPDIELTIDEAYNIYSLTRDYEIFEIEVNALIILGIEVTLEFYDLATALDPNSEDSMVIDNIYGSGVRVKTTIYEDKTFNLIKGRQLEVINHGIYGIYSVTIDGFFNEDTERGDALIMQAFLYDNYNAIFDSVYIYAFRKTGFEDIEHQVLSE